MVTMSAVYTNIYLCEISQPHSGFAKFGTIYKRKTSGTRKEALSEVLTARSKWTKVTRAHTAGGLDMKFKVTDGPSLVFVTIPSTGEGSATVFGKRVVVDADISGPKDHEVVGSVMSHTDANGRATICSFTIDLAKTVARFNNISGGHDFTRFPIVFDFVDMVDGVSPVFKSPHEHALFDKTKALGHGGIHPPSVASMIIVE